MDSIKLEKAPLKEVIFEGRWQLDVNEDNKEADNGLEVAIGTLRQLSIEKYSYHKRKFENIVPYQWFKHQLVHQYWKSENEWPVIQLGPGIFTFNDINQNYDWSKIYFPSLIETVEWLYKSYDYSIKMNFARLTYIDSVNTADYGYADDWHGFINRFFRFNFQNHFNFNGKLNRFEFNQFFDLPNGSVLNFNISTGKQESQNYEDPIILWQTSFYQQKNFSKDELIAWADEAHTQSRDIFKKLITEELYESFKV